MILSLLCSRCMTLCNCVSNTCRPSCKCRARIRILSVSTKLLLAVWIELERSNPAFFQDSELSLQASLVSDNLRHGSIVSSPDEKLVFERSFCSPLMQQSYHSTAEPFLFLGVLQNMQ